MTDFQKQCLLLYLGFDCGAPDGVWGEKSAGAAAEFQKAFGLEADGVFGPATEEKILSVISGGNFWDGIRYFRRQEFACRCGACGGFPAEPSETLVKIAEDVRAYFGEAAQVSSGVRCKSHNAAVGGVAGSRHLTGKAMDFRIRGRTAPEVLEYVWKRPGIRYAYAIDRYFVHMDVE